MKRLAILIFITFAFSSTSHADTGLDWGILPCPRPSKPKPEPTPPQKPKSKPSVETQNVDRDGAMLLGAVTSSIVYGGLKSNGVKSKHAYVAAVLSSYAVAGLTEKTHDNRTKAGQYALPSALLAPLLFFEW